MGLQYPNVIHAAGGVRVSRDGVSSALAVGHVVEKRARAGIASITRNGPGDWSVKLEQALGDGEMVVAACTRNRESGAAISCITVDEFTKRFVTIPVFDKCGHHDFVDCDFDFVIMRMPEGVS